MSDWVISYKIKVWHVKLRLNLHKTVKSESWWFLFKFTQQKNFYDKTWRERQSIVVRRMNHNEKRMHEKKKSEINNKEIQMNGHSKHLNLPQFMTFKKWLTFAGGVVEDDLFASDVDARLSLIEFSILRWRRKEKYEWNITKDFNCKTVRARQKVN